MRKQDHDEEIYGRYNEVSNGTSKVEEYNIRNEKRTGWDLEQIKQFRR